MSYEIGTADEFSDLLVKLDTFLLKGHSLVPIFTGTGNGTISDLIGTANTIQETITITLTSDTAFTVVGSVTGSLGSGTVGTLFTHSKVQFTVNAGSVAWTNGDTISFIMTPPWERRRLRGAASWIASSGFDFFQVTDGSTSSSASILASVLPQYGGAKFLKAEEIRSFRLRIGGNVTYGPTAYSLEYSDNDVDYSTALSLTGQTWSSTYEIRSHDVPSCGTHRFWRLRVTGTNSTYAQICELTFYTATGCVSADALPWYGDAIWCAPGNGDLDEIYVGAQVVWNSVGAYWCWRLAGMIGYVAANAFTSQPGFFSASWMTLWNNQIPYWFIASGKSVKVVAKVSTQYEQCYLGFLDQYISPGNYPYPLLIGGSLAFQYRAVPELTSSAYRYSDTSDNHRAWWTPGGDGNYGYTNYDYGQALLRRVESTIVAFQGTSGYCNGPYIWPYSMRSGSRKVGFQDVRLNLDGTVPMFPIIFHEATPNCYGEPEGVMAIHGNSQGVENIIVRNRINWLVVQNVMRVGINDYVAYQLA